MYSSIYVRVSIVEVCLLAIDEDLLLKINQATKNIFF